MSRPTITSTDGSRSRAWATRPPQNVPRPVTRTRRPTGSDLPEPDALARLQHFVQRLLQPDPDVLGLVHDPALRVALLVGRHVEADGIEHAELELDREV